MKSLVVFRLLAVVGTTFLLFSGCADTELGGSLSEAFDLSFSSVQIRRSPEAIQINYLKSEGREVVISLTVATEGIDVNNTIDLGGEYQPGHRRAAVSRAMDGEPVHTLPFIERGELSFDDHPDVGKSVHGSFSLSFADGEEIGAGRTLEGEFTALVEETR